MTFIKLQQQFTLHCGRCCAFGTFPPGRILAFGSHTSAKFLAATFVLLTMIGSPGKAPAQTPKDSGNTAKSFQTDLWQLEFHKAEKEQEAHRQNGAATGKGGQPVPLEKSESKATTAMLTNPLISDEEELNQLRTETTFDELQIESSLATEQDRGSFRHETTAWALSQARGSMVPASEELSKGPTLTTFLVGIVACIVMTGAIFS